MTNILLAGSLFFALIALLVSVVVRRLVIEDTQGDLHFMADTTIQKFYSELADIKKDIADTFAQNPKLVDALERANAARDAFTKEEIAAQIKTMEEGWQAASWDDLSKQVCDQEVNQILKQYKIFTRIPFAEIFLTDRRGLLIGSTEKTTDYYQADEEWWQKAYKEGFGAVYRSEIEYDESSRVYSLVIAVPIYDSYGAVRGVLKCVIDKDRVFHDIFEPFLGPGVQGGIMRADGQVLFSAGIDIFRNRGPQKALLDYSVSQREANPLMHKEGGRGFVIGFSRMDAGLLSWSQDAFVYLAKDEYAVLEPLRRIYGWLFFIWLGATVVFWAVSFRLTRIFLSPLAILRDGFVYLKRGIFDHKIPVERHDEFGALAEDFNSVIDELRKNTISKNHFNQIIQSMSDMLFVVDNAGMIEIVNRRMCEALEYEERELKGMPAADLFAKKDRYIMSWGLRGLIEEGALRDEKVTLLTRSGRETEVYLGTRSLRDASNNLLGLVCLAKDLTEINRLMEALKRSNDEILRNKRELEKSFQELLESRDVMLSILEDTNEAKLQLEETLKKLRGTQDQLFHAEKMISLGQIAAGVAHEINNPLFVISGEAEMLSQEKDLPQGTSDSVKIIREQVARINDIIKRLLEFSRKKEPRTDPVEVHALLKKTMELFQYQVKILPNVRLVHEFAQGPLWVSGDESQLSEVFLNLMINAAQSMEKKTGALTIRTFSDIIKSGQLKIGSPLQPEDHVVCVQVIDTGTGMTVDILKHIFDPFFTTKETGTGLGLPVCYGIVNNHGGIIDVVSMEGEGTTFTVCLPAGKAPQP